MARQRLPTREAVHDVHPDPSGERRTGGTVLSAGACQWPELPSGGRSGGISSGAYRCVTRESGFVWHRGELDPPVTRLPLEPRRGANRTPGRAVGAPGEFRDALAAVVSSEEKA